jgi:transposase
MKALSGEEVDAIYEQGREAVKGMFMQLQARIEELERQQRQNSQNSSKPPSSDGYRKPQPKSLRRKTGRRSGGQKGHAGTTLEMAAEPDHVVDYWPERCSGCGSELGQTAAAGYEARQVHDIPPIAIEVTEHRGMKVCCGQCQAINQGRFPESVKPGVQYGNGVMAFGIYAHVYQLLPLERTSEFAQDVLGCQPSEGTWINKVIVCAKQVAPSVEQIKAAIRAAQVMYVDETGMRVMKKLQWLHTMSTERLTYYAVDAKRGREAQDRIGVLPGFAGVMMHDKLLSYDLNIGTHALCGAHLLRELTALQQDTPQRWPIRLQTLLIQIKTAVSNALALGRTELSQKMMAAFDADYDRLTRRALQANPRPHHQPHQRGRPKSTPARNLAERLRDHKDCILRFMHDFRVAFDNNLAERDLRMMKVKQKISGCFRSDVGAQRFALIRSYVSTARKQGFRAFDAIRAACDGKPLKLLLA